MDWERPPVRVFWRAVESYLRLAYDGPAPATVEARLAALRSAEAEAFYQSPVLERPPAETEPTRYSLRLGSRFYPHMKLVIDRSPAGTGYQFRADTHDRHICVAPGSRDYEAFQELMRKNQALASEIESAWDREGLPTFKQFLREDLARRRGQKEDRASC